MTKNLVYVDEIDDGGWLKNLKAFESKHCLVEKDLWGFRGGGKTGLVYGLAQKCIDSELKKYGVEEYLHGVFKPEKTVLPINKEPKWLNMRANILPSYDKYMGSKHDFSWSV